MISERGEGPNSEGMATLDHCKVASVLCCVDWPTRSDLSKLEEPKMR